MPSKVIIIVIEFMFLGINIFWAFLRAHFNPCLTARAKMSLSRAENMFMPANINSIVLLVMSICHDLNSSSNKWILLTFLSNCSFAQPVIFLRAAVAVAAITLNAYLFHISWPCHP